MLIEINDEEFIEVFKVNIFCIILDLEELFILFVKGLGGKFIVIINLCRWIIMIIVGLVVLVCIVGLLLFISNIVFWLDGDRISVFFEESCGMYFVLLIVLFVYLVGGLLFFLVMVLLFVVVVIFGFIWGLIYGIFGVLFSVGIIFLLGKGLGNVGLCKLVGLKVEVVDEKLVNIGIVGVVIICMLFIVLFSLVNFVVGIFFISLV